MVGAPGAHGCILSAHGWVIGALACIFGAHGRVLGAHGCAHNHIHAHLLSPYSAAKTAKTRRNAVHCSHATTHVMSSRYPLGLADQASRAASTIAFAPPSASRLVQYGSSSARTSL